MFFCARSHYRFNFFSVKFSFFWLLFLFYMIILFYFFSFFLGELGFSIGILLLFLFFLKKINIGFFLGDFIEGDFFGFYIVTITVIVFFLMVLSRSFEFFKSNNWPIFLVVIAFFLLFLVGVFICRRFIIFYLLFEIAVVPIFVVIIGWGYRVNRTQAALYMFLYTFFTSIPFLIFLLFLYVEGFRFVFQNMFFCINSRVTGSFLWVIFSLVFMIKLPVFFFHLWLPKAHVEAPLLGSMVLAGVLLKLGGYGLYKTIMFLWEDFIVISSFLGTFSLLGGCWTGLVCLRQVDLKSLVAYSSVVHIAPVFVVILFLSYLGFLGGLTIIFSHGLCSSCLFFILNLSYIKIGSRSYLLNRGGIVFFPFISFFWLLFCISNIGFPPTFNFFSELLVVLRVFYSRYLILFLLFFIMLFSGFYRVMLYIFFNHGEKKIFLAAYSFFIKDMVCVFLSLYYLFFFIFYLPLFFYLYYFYFVVLEYGRVIVFKCFSFLCVFSHVFLYLLSLRFINESVFIFLSFRDFSFLKLRFIFLIDFYSYLFSSFILLISCVVLYYRFFYIDGDQNMIRFLTLVLLFVSSILFLVFLPSLLGIILGWDALGVSSFILVIFYNNVSSLRSGILTIYLNRLGDVFFIFSFFFIFSLGFFMVGGFLDKIYFLFFLFILFAGITKRAQIPFSSWLPAAMSAPTPVSSLVHSSTLVTAGVYLFIRFYYLIRVFFLRVFLWVVSCLTFFSAGLIACTERDIKKLVAMSTLRQLGMIMFSFCLGNFFLTFFHLIRHALFKSLLFLTCGFIIMTTFSIQDMRFIGGKISVRKRIFYLIFLSVISLIGGFFLRGFFSKDIIIDMVFRIDLSLGFLLLFIFSCFFSILYRVKFLYEGFLSHHLRISENVASFFKVVGFFLGALFFWSIFFGKIFYFYFFDGELSMFVKWQKLVGIAFLFIGLLFFLLYINKLAIKIVAFFWEMLFLTWFFGGFFRRKLALVGIFLVGEFYWLEKIGVISLAQIFWFFIKKFFHPKNYFVVCFILLISMVFFFCVLPISL